MKTKEKEKEKLDYELCSMPGCKNSTWLAFRLCETHMTDLWSVLDELLRRDLEIEGIPTELLAEDVLEFSGLKVQKAARKAAGR